MCPTIQEEICSPRSSAVRYLVSTPTGWRWKLTLPAGLPTYTTVGLPEASVKESKERVKSAIGNSGYRFPDDRITVNLAPAAIKKEGTGYYLPLLRLMQVT